MALSVFVNPKSNIRSASSSTNICSVTQSNIGVSSMCCNNLPGVHTKIFILFTLFASSCTSFPPINSPADIVCLAPTFVRH